LHFQERRPFGGRICGGFGSPRRLPVQHFIGQVQPGKRRVANLDFLGDRQRVAIVREPAVIGQALIERVLAGMSKRRMANVVKQGQRLDQVLVQPQRSADRASDRRHLMRVGQPRAVIVAHLAGEDLHLAAQAAERAAMHDPVAVALERPAIAMLRLGVPAAARVGAVHRIGRQQGRFTLGGGLQGSHGGPLVVSAKTCYSRLRIL
jgi:hypothetical protein